MIYIFVIPVAQKFHLFSLIISFIFIIYPLYIFISVLFNLYFICFTLVTELSFLQYENTSHNIFFLK